MKKFKRIGAILLAVSMTMACLMGCGDTTDVVDDTAAVDTTDVVEDDTEEVEVQDVQLKVWGPEEEQDFMKEMCDLFAQNHPEYNITFEFAVMGNDASIDELKKDADLAADVFMFPSGGVPELVEAGLIYPLTIGADEIKANHSATSIKGCSIGDQLYGVPQTPNSWFMYYNSSMYTEDEVKSLETMMAKDLGDDVYNFSCAISNSWYMEAWFYALGGTLYGADGTDATACSWNDENGMKAGQYLVDLANNEKYVEDIDGIASSLFKEGKLGAMCSGTWSAAELQEALGDNYAACKLPTINVDGTDYQLSNFADFRAFGVKSSTKYPEAAQQLAAWLGSEEVQLASFEQLGTAPTVVSLLSNETVLENKAVAALANQTNYSTPQPTTPQLAEYWSPATALGTGIVNGDVTASNLQESLDSMVNAFTSKLVE